MKRLPFLFLLIIFLYGCKKTPPIQEGLWVAQEHSDHFYVRGDSIVFAEGDLLVSPNPWGWKPFQSRKGYMSIFDNSDIESKVWEHPYEFRKDTLLIHPLDTNTSILKYMPSQFDNFQEHWHYEYYGTTLDIPKKHAWGKILSKHRHLSPLTIQQSGEGTISLIFNRKEYPFEQLDSLAEASWSYYDKIPDVTSNTIESIRVNPNIPYLDYEKIINKVYYKKINPPGIILRRSYRHTIKKIDFDPFDNLQYLKLETKIFQIDSLWHKYQIQKSDSIPIIKYQPNMDWFSLYDETEDKSPFLWKHKFIILLPPRETLSYDNFVDIMLEIKKGQAAFFLLSEEGKNSLFSLDLRNEKDRQEWNEGAWIDFYSWQQTTPGFLLAFEK